MSGLDLRVATRKGCAEGTYGALRRAAEAALQCPIGTITTDEYANRCMKVIRTGIEDKEPIEIYNPPQNLKEFNALLDVFERLDLPAPELEQQDNGGDLGVEFCGWWISPSYNGDYTGRPLWWRVRGSAPWEKDTTFEFGKETEVVGWILKERK